MSSYAACQGIEEAAWEWFGPWLVAVSDDGRYTKLQSRRQDFEAQKRGDASAFVEGREQWFELKAEAEEKHGNFFLESWSNKRAGRRGWMFTCRADWLCYLFLEPSPVLYCFEFLAVKAWAFTEGVQRFPEKRQAKYQQGNDTWGWAVPIETLVAEVERVPKIWTWDGARWT